MKPYSVLVLYPAYVANFHGESYYAFVMARGPFGAAEKAKLDAALASDGNPADFKCLLVIDGHHPPVEIPA